MSHASPAQLHDIAVWRVQKILNEYEQVATLNRAHGADLARTPESGIANTVRDAVATQRQAELLEIHKGWPGSAGGGQVQLQRFASADPARNRRRFWRMFQTLIHEYVHTITHSRYSAYADSLGDPRGHTLREGVTDVFDGQVPKVLQIAPEPLAVSCCGYAA